MSGFYSMLKLIFISVVVSVIGIQCAYSQKIKLNTYLDTTTILIGDQLKYNIELEQPQNIKVVFPLLVDSLASKIEIIETEPADTAKSGDNLVIRKQYLITSFDSGYHKIPSYKFAFTLDNIKDTISSQELFLTVNTLPVDTAKEIMDIKPVMSTPFSFSEIKTEIIIGLAVLAILALAIWIILRYRKNKPIFAPRKPQEPPHITALKALNNLRAEKLWQNNQVKLYYTRITDILRTYIFGRFGVNAMEMTSDEILSALEMELNTDMELKTSFSKLLMQADMVKFAKEEPLPQENEVSLLSAYTFVNHTKIEVISNPENNTPKPESGKE